MNQSISRSRSGVRWGIASILMDRHDSQWFATTLAYAKSAFELRWLKGGATVMLQHGQDIHATFGRAGLKAAANGYHVLPIPAGTKKIRVKNWTRFCRHPPSETTLAGWNRTDGTASVALACGWSIVAIDIDEEDPARAQSYQALTELFLGPTPLVRFGRAPRRVLLYGIAGDASVPSSNSSPVQILGDKHYVMAYGLHPQTGQHFHWVGASPASLPRSELPRLTPCRVRRLAEALALLHGPEPSGPADREMMPAPTIVGERPRLRPYVTARWPRENGRVIDHREAFLAHLVFRAALARPGQGAEAIAQAAWAAFEVEADLTRPRGNGTRPWVRGDAHVKAKAILASTRAQERLRDRAPGALKDLRALARSDGPNPFWTEATKAVFSRRVDEARLKRALSPAAHEVSQCMLGLVHGQGACFASVDTLAEDTGLSRDTVKRARARLRAIGLWFSHLDKGGEGYTALYWPNPAVLNDGHQSEVLPEEADTGASPPKTVAVSATMINRGGWGDQIGSADFDALIQTPTDPEGAPFQPIEKEDYL